jgi:hypothetical protein
MADFDIVTCLSWQKLCGIFSKSYKKKNGIQPAASRLTRHINQKTVVLINEKGVNRGSKVVVKKTFRC